jgi:choline dehydrogenase
MGASPALQRWGAHELFPSPLARTHSALESWVRANAMTTYHYGGTCRLGDDPRAPVDGRLRLRGVSGVRVADASAIPVVPVSALNAPSMLMGLRAARFMREDFVGPLH